MPEIDWTLTTWQGNRVRQHLEFFALPFREKLQALEDMAEVVRLFRPRPPVAGPPPVGKPSGQSRQP